MDVERSRRRRRRAHNEEDVGGYQGPDRISHLPDEVAHHILSFLPMEAVAQTSTLSKRWKSIWRTLPVVDFDENRFQHLDDLQCRQEFLYSISRLLLSEDLGRALIKKTRVIAIHPHDAGLELLINLFIDLPLSKSKMLELDITIDDDNSYTYEDCTKIAYSLPDRVFEAGSYLTALYLKFCSIGPYENVKFPFLKTMSMTFVLIPDEMLTNVITNSPNLEDLSLLYCFHMVDLRVSNSNLRYLTVGTRSDLTLLEMDAPKLEMFDYHGILPDHDLDIDEHAVQNSRIVDFSSPNKFGLESLKTFIVAHIRMDDTTLRKMLSAFRFLETAKLHCCTFGVVPFILNPRLETLEIEDCRQERMLLHSQTLQTIRMMSYQLIQSLSASPDCNLTTSRR